MKTMQTLLKGIAAALLCCGAPIVQAGTYNLTAITCGNWNSAGIHDPSTLYQIGFSFQRPNNQIAYFEFDLTPLQGKTVTGAEMLIPGSTDYSISDFWSTPDDGLTNNVQFKVGIRPMCNTNYPITLSAILTGNNNGTLYTDANDMNRNQDLGYQWTVDGFHLGKQFGSFTYNTYRLQNAVNAGGDYIIWAADDFDSGNVTGENYIWGSTSYNTNIVYTITTSN